MSEKSIGKLEYLKLGAQLLGILEKLLPAFLVTWNNYLQQKNAGLKFTIERMEIEKKTNEFNKQLDKEASDPIAVINTILADPDDSGAVDNKNKL